jgi:hypothetical protein
VRDRIARLAIAEFRAQPLIPRKIKTVALAAALLSAPASVSEAALPFYLDHALRLIATLPGDANGDGSVAFADFQRLELGFGQAGGWQQGDFNLDGVVDTLDVGSLLGHFGQSAAATAALPVPPVPEPGTLSILAIGVALGLARRRPTRRTASQFGRRRPSRRELFADCKSAIVEQGSRNLHRAGARASSETSRTR